MKRNHTGHRVGESHQRATLTDEQVREIRRRYVPYVVSYGKLARQYGVGESTIRDICQHWTRASA